MMNRRIINALLLISFLIIITAITPDTDPLDAPQDLSDYECCVDINVAVDIVKDDVCIVESTGYLTEGTVLSDDEYDLLARCVEAEAGSEGLLGKQYVVDVILNRVDSYIYPDTITDVILQKNQFEVVSNDRIYDIVPTEETYEAIDKELNYRQDSEITLFRTEYYHKFGTPKFQYKHHYFSIY